MKFTKMHGLGNDFIVIDARSEKLDELNFKQLAIELSDRHFGIGADGIVIVWPSTKAHYRMQILNPDGSEPEMCGNGLRCFAKYVYEKDKLKEEVISVETKAGIRLPAVILSPIGEVEGVEVDMGQPEITDNLQLTTDNGTFEAHIISMGNPHAVIFVDDLSKINLFELGPQIENDSHFPNRTNVEFVKILNDKELEVIVWERGVGETLACGTGACACAVASGKKRALVHLPGGNLDIEIGEEGKVLMRGPAKTVFEGEIN